MEEIESEAGFNIWESCGIIRDGRVAEWLMALVLKTSRLTSRRFESCPFRQAYAGLYKKGGFVSMMRILSLVPILFRCCGFFRVWRSW